MGTDCICLKYVSDGNLERDWLAPEEDFKIPAFLRVITSSVVYSSKSPVMPRRSMSFMLKGPTVMKGACFGVIVWCSVVMQNNYLWKKISRELHASRNEKTSVVVIIMYLHSVQFYVSSLHTIRLSVANETGWFSWFLNVMLAGSSLLMNPRNRPCKMEDPWQKPCTHHSYP